MGKFDDFEVESTQTRSAKHQVGGRASLALPPGLSMWKPKKNGSHTIDIIPYIVTENIHRFDQGVTYARVGRFYHERTYYVHRGVGINNETHTCSARVFGKPCCICEDRKRFEGSNHVSDQKMAKLLTPKERQLFLIWDHEEHDKGVQLWDIATFNFGVQLDNYVENARPQDKEAYSKFHSHKTGFEMRISGLEKAMGEGMGTNTVYSVHQFYPRERPIPDSILDHGYDLDAIVRETDAAVLRKIYTGLEEGAEGPSRSEAPPRGRHDENPPPRVRHEETPPPSRRHEEPPPSRRHEDDPPPRSRTRDEDAPARPRETPPPARSREEDPAPSRPRETAPPRARDEDEAPPVRNREAPPPARAPRDEAPPAKSAGNDFGPNDVVRWDYRGNVMEGVIERVDLEKDVAFIKVEGRERAQIVDIPELTLVRRDDTWDKKATKKAAPPADEPPANKAAARRTEWDDTLDDRSFQRKPAATAPPADDEEPPTRRRS